MEPESNEIQTNSLLNEYESCPRKFEIYSLAAVASLLQIIYPKCITLQDPFDDNVDDDVLDPDENTEKWMIELSNGIVIKQWQNPHIIHYRNYSKKIDPENYYREKLVLFYHWRKEHIDLIGKFDTYEEHYKALEDQILPVQLKYERNNDILQKAMEEINAKQNKENIEEDYTENKILTNTKDEHGFFDPDRARDHRVPDIGEDLGVTHSGTYATEVDCLSNRVSDSEYRQLMQSIKSKVNYAHTSYSLLTHKLIHYIYLLKVELV